MFADLAGMPPALFSVGSGDPLLDETLHLAHRWAAVSRTELFVAPFLPHGFTVFPRAITDHWTATLQAWFDARLAG
ncbi:alpha/beta hydrolase [Frankia sp. AgKG'84/4]|uniref:alpha/beta hydrolase n=1 Tax=Frankia sp. AgKG'84/4 TaxID=573490 RepID=UPI00200DF1C9|nr:alpha/beta hydrolase fold domain-containing protein [Frankia sp. AgKG'84/4]MCL9795457.1 alpha/beta hydrolase [Frankia sp. AgKG'84/4]